MRGMVPNDPQTSVSNTEFSVIYAPRKKRTRFPASCVEIKTSLEQAIEEQNIEKKRYAARVHGPSKSSEGQYIYYLLNWL